MADLFPLANVGRILPIHSTDFPRYVELFMRVYIGESNAVFLWGVRRDAATEQHKTGFRASGRGIFRSAHGFKHGVLDEFRPWIGLRICDEPFKLLRTSPTPSDGAEDSSML